MVEDIKSFFKFSVFYSQCKLKMLGCDMLLQAAVKKNHISLHISHTIYHSLRLENRIISRICWVAGSSSFWSEWPALSVWPLHAVQCNQFLWRCCSPDMSRGVFFFFFFEGSVWKADALSHLMGCAATRLVWSRAASARSRRQTLGHPQRQVTVAWWNLGIIIKKEHCKSYVGCESCF